ncbi:MAG: tRNA (adenosine(37)-N6)-threonylcarbamoyltransferase complex transferase subunit TsaD [Candidatus Zixiibacteriota bacterium]|nr:MAG: tRNA (adenosine(37)-N6)-threonylcarbamoyltransferase complex transferase subunit TsaD [candidate division Zixibacteria bacterium]
MLLLSIETSCDETAAAVLRDGVPLSSVVATHWMHSQFGGVVPELASRAHLKLLLPILEQVLDDSRVAPADLEAVVVTRGPGLIGSLLVGISFAKSLAYARDLPLVGVNHLEGHLWSACLERPDLDPPFLALLVSGGHTLLVGVEGFGQYRLVGQTRDDAAGEAFDKVAVLCGLGYPGGAGVEKRARMGQAGYHAFPVGMRGQPGYDFSFSGLKTAVGNFLRRHPEALTGHLDDLLASFQEAAVQSLVGPALRAFDDLGYSTLVISGGVAANSRLRERLAEEVEARGGSFIFPGLHLCTDNAAMIGWVGWRRLLAGERDSLDMSGEANLPLPGLIPEEAS